MLGQLNMYGMDKVEVSIERFKAFEPEEGYFLAFSGGKDSCVIKALADMADVKYDAHYTVTSVDPPELVQFIREYHPDVSMDIPRYPDNYKNEKLRGKQITMWNLIPEKKMPPTRIVRYCCATLKEPHGEGRFVVTGVRHAESAKRQKRGGLEMAKKKSHKMTNYDPDEPTEEMFYHCKIYARKMLNPIIDWTEEDVWEFLHTYNIPYCKLYDEGWKRLGCIGCPMGTVEHRRKEFAKWSKYKTAYIHAFERMIADRNGGGTTTQSNKEQSSSGNGQTTALESSTTNNEQNKKKPKIKYPEIIEKIDGMDAEERFEYWLEPNAKSEEKPKGWGRDYDDGEELFEAWRGAPSGMPFKSKSDELIPASIEVHDKKITAVPRWDDSSTGEEVMNWWIK